MLTEGTNHFQNAKFNIYSNILPTEPIYAITWRRCESCKSLALYLKHAL